MKQKQPAKHIVIVLGFLAFVMCVSYYFVWQDIAQKNHNAALLLRDLSSAVNKEQYLASLSKTIQNSDSDIARVSSSIIPSDGDVAFIENLEDFAKANGLEMKIDSLSFDDTVISTTTGMTVFRVSAKTTGSWAGTYKFLAELEALPFKIKINKFGFLGSGDTGGGKGTKPSSVWQSSFEIRILKYN